MEFALLGFLTGLSLILAIGAQNIFVIEQGLKKQHFLIHFIYSKIKSFNSQVTIDQNSNLNEKKDVILKTLGFTFLNPHVYSDTVFFLGNFSKNLLIIEKYFFGIGATIASFLFFFSIGYLSQYFSKYLNDKKIWKYINIFIILFMFLITVYVFRDVLKFYTKS